MEKEAFKSPRKAVKGIKKYLADDSFMGGVSQSNEGGESQQRGDFPARCQIGMGSEGILYSNPKVIELKE